jgi:hypothetical protein
MLPNGFFKIQVARLPNGFFKIQVARLPNGFKKNSGSEVAKWI